MALPIPSVVTRVAGDQQQAVFLQHSEGVLQGRNGGTAFCYNGAVSTWQPAEVENYGGQRMPDAVLQQGMAAVEKRNTVSQSGLLQPGFGSPDRLRLNIKAVDMPFFPHQPSQQHSIFAVATGGIGGMVSSLQMTAKQQVEKRHRAAQGISFIWLHSCQCFCFFAESKLRSGYGKVNRLVRWLMAEWQPYRERFFMIREFTVPASLAGERLDLAVATLAGVSRGEGRRIIDRGGCALNRSMVRVASRSVAAGDLIIVGIMQPGEFRPLQHDSVALIYQDEELLALNKPAGVPSQRTPYQLKGTLEQWVADQFAAQGIREPVRVIHRLDRGTSGLMLFPKDRRSAAWLSQLFKDRLVIKRYIALVSGQPESQVWTADGSIGKLAPSRWGVVQGGLEARTDFRLLATDGQLSVIEALPVTGRTHQIRVHLAAGNLPIIGDPVYGGKAADRMMLHCAALEFDKKDGTRVELKGEPDLLFSGLSAGLLSLTET